MKVSPLYFLLVLSIVNVPGNANADWTMVFDDEFQGPSLNRDAWFTRYLPGGDSLDRLNDEKEVYRDNDNHVFKDGHLALTARSTGIGTYESGMIRSKRTFYYGYFETRVKFPPGRGLSSAFWLNSDYGADERLSWPPEIDIFEFVNNGKDDRPEMVHSATDSDDAGNKLIYANPRFNTRWSSYVGNSDLTKDWHVFGLMWLPDSVTVYMDGLKLYSKGYKWVYKGGALAGPAHVLVNLAIGGQWAGRYGIDDSAFPQSLDVDYIRVYQFDADKPGALALPNVPDLASYSYHAVGDLARPIVYPAELPQTVKPGGLMSVIYHIESVPAKNKTKLRLSINEASSGKSVYERAFELPHDTREAVAMMKSRIGVAVPAGLAAGDYDVRLALGYCPTPGCKPATYTNIPLTAAGRAIREANAWYTVGHVRVED